MMAEEYIPVDITLIYCSPDWSNKSQHQNISLTTLTLLKSSSGLTEHGMPSHRQALALQAIQSNAPFKKVAKL